MIAVIFEVVPTRDGKTEYLKLAAELKEHLASVPGFISVERFQSLANPEKLLSMSFWETEEAVERWQKFEAHYFAQVKGSTELFQDYRIRVCSVFRDYTLANHTK